MSWCARRLQHEPFDERSARKFPPGGSSPNWRSNSALFFFFEIGEKCEKTLQTPHQTEGDDNDLLRLDVVDFRAFEAL